MKLFIFGIIDRVFGTEITGRDPVTSYLLSLLTVCLTVGSDWGWDSEAPTMGEGERREVTVHNELVL